jgi:hypothetical protein
VISIIDSSSLGSGFVSAVFFFFPGNFVIFMAPVFKHCNIQTSCVVSDNFIVVISCSFGITLLSFLEMNFVSFWLLLP